MKYSTSLCLSWIVPHSAPHDGLIGFQYYFLYTLHNVLHFYHVSPYLLTKKQPELYTSTFQVWLQLTDLQSALGSSWCKSRFFDGIGREKAPNVYWGITWWQSSQPKGQTFKIIGGFWNVFKFSGAGVVLSCCVLLRLYVVWIYFIHTFPPPWNCFYEKLLEYF